MAERLHQHGLVLRQEDLGPVLQHEHVLFPPGDVQQSLVVEAAEVSGAEDAVLQHGARRIRALVVALHHAGGGLDEDLPVLGERDRVVRADLHGEGVALHGDRNAGAGLGQAVAEADAQAHRARRREQPRRTVARADEHKLELGIDAALLDQKAEQQRHDGNRRGAVEITVVQVVARSAAQRHAAPAAQAPEQAAHKAENMAQRQQAQQPVLRRERQLLRAVPGALAQAVVREHHGFGLFGGAGGEKEDPAFPVPHARHQRRGELLLQLLVAPEQVRVGVTDQGLEQRRVQRGVQQHQLQPREVGGKKLDDIVQAAVAEQAQAGLARLAQRLGARGHAVVQPGEGKRLLFPAQRGGVGACLGKMRKQMRKTVESHGDLRFSCFFPLYHTRGVLKRVFSATLRRRRTDALPRTRP